jgi:hypothetical protein
MPTGVPEGRGLLGSRSVVAAHSPPPCGSTVRRRSPDARHYLVMVAGLQGAPGW